MDPAHVVAEKSAFDMLNEDVLYLIFERVLPDSLVPTSLVCRSLRRVARPFLYRSIAVRRRHLGSSVEHAEPKFEELLRRYTRHLKVDVPGLSWKGVANLICRLQKLDTFTWSLPNEPVDVQVLKSLRRYWPNASLEIHHKLESHIAPASQLTRLHGCSNLQSLKVNIHLTWGDVPYPCLKFLKDVLTSCTDLRRLELRFASFPFPTTGDAGRFSFEEGEHLPAFEEVVLDHYYWRAKKDHEPDQGAAWNWSRLRRLTLRDIRLCHFFQSVQGKISHLDYLEIEGISDRRAAKALNDFLRTITGLKELVLSSNATDLDMAALAHHGSTLTSLTLRGWLDGDLPTVPDYASEDYLDQLNKSCPHLTELRIEVVQTTWLEASTQIIPTSESISKLMTTKAKSNFLDPLARFQRLRALTIHVEKIFPDKKRQARDWTIGDKKSLGKIFEYLAKRKEGLPLKRLSLVFHYNVPRSEGEPTFNGVKILTCTPEESLAPGGTVFRFGKAESFLAADDSAYSKFLSRWQKR